MKPTQVLAAICLLCSALALSIQTDADVRLPNIFGSNMVLQQEMPLRFFGWADPGEKVSVECLGQSAETVADENGNWRVELPGRLADGNTFHVKIKGKNEIDLNNCLLGEVWICSGQSNMEWSVARSAKPQEEINAANYPEIRLFNVPRHVTSNRPENNVAGNWQECTPQTVTDFSAVGYHFGRELFRETEIPIGLIGSNWGGTRIEPWTPKHGFDSVEQLDNISRHLEKIDPTTDAGKKYHNQYLAQVEDWVQQARKDVEAGKLPGAPPTKNDFQPVSNATTIYNAMVHGMAPFSVRGVIWYQGESNAGDGLRYQHLKKGLVNGWRETFENPELSFYWVQLAGFQQPDDNPAGSGWGPVREGQRRAMEIPNTGMAVTIDIGQANDIHPRNKQDVGKRLSRWALRDHYGQSDLVPSGPLYKSMKAGDGKIVISFEHVGDGLMTGKKSGMDPVVPTNESELTQFAIAGADQQWKWAQAKIEGDTVVVWHDEISEPAAVRYSYQSNPVGANLYNKNGLPASPFKTDDWN